MYENPRVGCSNGECLFSMLQARFILQMLKVKLETKLTAAYGMFIT
jgi:hypothetical protein